MDELHCEDSKEKGCFQQDSHEKPGNLSVSSISTVVFTNWIYEVSRSISNNYLLVQLNMKLNKILTMNSMTTDQI